MIKAKTSSLLTNLLLVVLVLAVIPGWMGIKSVRAGKDTNWDLRNYHYYNGYAILTDRMDIDIAPAQQQTYLNPILDVPVYWLYTHLPSRYAGFFYGFVHGLNISLILMLFFKLAIFRSNILKILGGAAVAIVASTAPGFLSELGSSMNDNIVSLFTLATILLVLYSVQFLKPDKKKVGFWFLGLAGFLMGFMIGGKLTAALFAISMGVFLPILVPTGKAKWQALVVFILGGAVGFLVSDGFWLWNLWQRFGNPLFPFYNGLFHSPFASSEPFLDKRFLPTGLTEYLTWPLIFSRNSLRVSELWFEDMRFAILYVALIFWAFVAVARFNLPRRNQSTLDIRSTLFDQRAGVYLICFASLSFVLWMVQFSIYRYIVPLELLVPLVFLLILDQIFSFKPLIPVFFLAALFFGFRNYAPYNWGRVAWTNRYVQIEQVQVNEVKKANVLMLGTSPMSYVIPFFAPDVRFLRPENNFMNYNSGLNDEIEQILIASKDPIYLLYDVNDLSVNLSNSSKNLGIDLSNLDCHVLQDNMPDDLKFCKVLVK